jgi:hypothetical protein
VAGRWLAAWHRRPSLPERSFLAHGGVHAPLAPDVGAARHDGLAARLRLLWCLVGAALSCASSPASWPGLRPADPDPIFQFGLWLITVRASPVGPDGCGPVTATGNRDSKEILSMCGPMSERAPDITVELEQDGRAESTTVLRPFRAARRRRQRVPPQRTVAPKIPPLIDKLAILK